MRQINIALVGACGYSHFYRRLYTQLDGARLAFLADIDEPSLKEVARELGVERYSVNFEDALGPDIDMVDISTPNFLHAEQAVAALNAGKHVLLQKPIATSVDDGLKIMHALEGKDLNAGVYMCRRDIPLNYDIKKLLKAGVLGRISSVYMRTAHTGGLNAKKDDWRSSLEKTGGGALIQLAIHDFNIVQWLLDDEITSVMGYSKNMMCSAIGGDDVTTATCEFSSGILGTIEAAYCAEGSRITIHGTEGVITVNEKGYAELNLELKAKNPFKGEVLNYKTPGELLRAPFQPRAESFRADNPYQQHVLFVKALQQNRPAPVPLSEGLRDLRIVQAIYRSAKEGVRVVVE